MNNFFFFSSQTDITFHRIKISIKFDNNGIGKARISLKCLLEKKNITENPVIYLYIQNVSRKITLEDIDDVYNDKLKTEDFRSAAGEENIDISNIDTFSLTTIDLTECSAIHNKNAIIPDNVEVDEKKTITGCPNIPEDTFNEGILLQITPLLHEKIQDKKLHKNIKTDFIEFQCRIFLKDFLTGDTITSLLSSSVPWSTALHIMLKSDIGEKNEKIKECILDPKFIDLWVTIPHGHSFSASSPVYASAIKLEKEDIDYKTYEKASVSKKAYYEQFETQQGDYAVRIKEYDNKAEYFGNFSIICTSPFLPDEKPEKLREDIDEFKEKSKELREDIDDFKKSKDQYVKWQDMISPLVLLLAVLSILFSLPSYEEKIGDETFTLFIKAILFGLVTWSIYIVISQVTVKIKKRWNVDNIALLLIIILVSIIIFLVFS